MLFIDASGEFVRGNAKNKLSDTNIENILNVYKNQEAREYFSYLATHSEIEDKEYNLSVNAYVEQEDTSEVVDIIELNKEIEQNIEPKNSNKRQRVR